MADNDDEVQEDPVDETEESNRLLDRIPLSGEMTRVVPVHSGPLTDKEYNDLMVRQNEQSLDGLVRGAVSNDRTSMASIDAMARSAGNFRRWVPVIYYYKLVVKWVWEVEKPKTKLDPEGKPIPKRYKLDSDPKTGPFTGPIKVDKKGQVQLEEDLFEPECKSKLEREWLPSVKALELVKDGTKLISSEEEQSLRNGKTLESEAGIAEYEGAIVKERLWHLSDTQSDRSVIGPRESMTKLPKRVLRRFIEILERLQKTHPETPIKDFYVGMYPEKWLPKDQWIETKALGQQFEENEARLRLGDLVIKPGVPNYYELTKIAEYYFGTRYFSAKKRWLGLVRERSYICRKYRAKYGKDITAKKLEKELDKVYQWWVPYVQHEFVRNWIPDKARLDDKEGLRGLEQVVTAAERADNLFESVNQISFIAYVPEPTGPGKVNISECLIYFPVNEEVRDIARMVGHFQQSKSQQWRYGKFNYSEADVNSALGADHGGAMSGGTMDDDLVFEICWEFIESQPANERRALRKQLLGGFHSMRPKNKRITAQGMYGEFGLRRYDITGGAKLVRGLISAAREGAGLKIDRTAILKELASERRYSGGQIDLLKGETYFWYDPWDIMKNNGGLKSDAMVNAFINRLSVYGNAPSGEPLIQIVDVMELKQENPAGSPEIDAIVNLSKSHEPPVEQPVKIDWFNQTEMHRQLVWKQPAENIIPHLLATFEEYKRDRVVHIRPKLRQDWLHGLPESVYHNPKFKEVVEDLNWRSDQRVLLWAGWKSHGSGHVAVRGLSQSFHDPFFADGFGTDNGLPEELQIEMCMNLAIMGWYNSQFDSAVKLARQITYNHEVNGSVVDKYELVQKSIGGGLHPDIANAVAESLTAGKVVKWDVFLKKEKPREVGLVENVFHELEALHLGREFMEIVKEGGVFRAMLVA